MTVHLKPLEIQTHVYPAAHVGMRQDGFVPAPKHHISELGAAELEGMLREYCESMIKAWKEWQKD